MPSQTTGYLIDPTTGVLTYITIHDPFDRLHHNTRSQMLLLLNARSIDVLPVEIDGAAHLIWHDAHCSEGHTSGLFQVDKLPFLAGRAVIFADDGKTAEDKDATPFGLGPTISAPDLAARITCYPGRQSQRSTSRIVLTEPIERPLCALHSAVRARCKWPQEETFGFHSVAEGSGNECY